MITFSFLKKRRYRIALILFFFGTIMLLATFLDGAYERYSPRGEERLGLANESNFPLREISGLFLKPANADGEREVLVVGDHAPRIGVGVLEGSEIKPKHFLDFSGAILERYGLCRTQRIAGCRKFVRDITTQWEAVSSDGSGRIFLLHEQLGSIFVVDSRAQRLVSLINFSAFEINPDRTRQPVTVDQENAGGEGFVLLRNGHILVIKERFKPSFIEFGPAGGRPEGYTPELRLGPDEAFPIVAEQVSLAPLKVWLLDKKYRACDLSELASDESGQLFLLSQQCQWIAQIDDLALGADEVTFQHIWDMPNKLKNSEALLVVDSHKFIVAEDKKSPNTKNIFVLTRQAGAASQLANSEPLP